LAEPTGATETATEEESFFAPSPEIDVPDQPAGPATEAPAVKRPEEDKPAAPPVTRAKHPAHPEAIRQAIDEVMQVIASLRESLEQLDEVLELLEEAERQKTADERDIESLRQQLRRFHRPPEEGSRSRSPQAQSGQRQPHRHQGDERRLHRSPRESREPRAPHEAHKAHRSHAAQPKSFGPHDAEIRPASPGSESTEPGSGTASSPADATGAGDPS
jgi:hypothetical protein